MAQKTKTTYTVTFDNGSGEEVTVTEQSTRTYTHALLVYGEEGNKHFVGWGPISFHSSRALAEKSYSQWSSIYQGHKVVEVQVAS